MIDSKTRIIVQGITGNQGSFHTDKMIKYGANVVAGVTPGKGGQVVAAGGKKIPVFNTVKEAKEMSLYSTFASDADGELYCVIFVPAKFALDACLEALHEDANLVIISEHIPVLDTIKIHNEASKKGLKVIGPNCPGIITPDETKIGITPGRFFTPGPVGIISRSGTLTYQISKNLTDSGIGQSTVVGIGGDMINGFNFIDSLKEFEKNDETRIIVLIGEIGGAEEENAALYIKSHVSKPVVAYIAGRTAPPGKTMGHAGAIISATGGTYNSKIEALKKAGVEIASSPSDVVELVKSLS